MAKPDASKPIIKPSRKTKLREDVDTSNEVMGEGGEDVEVTPSLPEPLELPAGNLNERGAAKDEEEAKPCRQLVSDELKDMVTQEPLHLSASINGNRYERVTSCHSSRALPGGDLTFELTIVVPWDQHVYFERGDSVVVYRGEEKVFTGVIKAKAVAETVSARAVTISGGVVSRPDSGPEIYTLENVVALMSKSIQSSDGNWYKSETTASYDASKGSRAAFISALTDFNASVLEAAIGRGAGDAGDCQDAPPVQGNVVVDFLEDF